MISTVLCSCAFGTKGSTSVSGSRSGIFSTDELAEKEGKQTKDRSSARLGIFTTEYLSESQRVATVQGALDGVTIQSLVVEAQTSAQDPDYDLLQAFDDALQVDVPDLLNRSDSREKALDSYSTALTNIGIRANDRFKELSTALESLKANEKIAAREVTESEQSTKKALQAKDFSAASEAQKVQMEKQMVLLEAQIQRSQVESIVTTLDQNLTLFGKKMLAIEKNREALIAGIMVEDVPGIEELLIIKRGNGQKEPSRRGGSFDSLFEGTGLR